MNDDIKAITAIALIFAFGFAGGYFTSYNFSDKGWNWGDVQMTCNQMCLDEVNENGDNLVKINENIKLFSDLTIEMNKQLQEQHLQLNSNQEWISQKINLICKE